ncbi:hypothetical protein SK128_022581, partial [Halocaridina rubra]
MNDEAQSKECKGQGDRTSRNQRAVADVSHLRAPSVTMHMETGNPHTVTISDSGIHQTVTLVNSEIARTVPLTSSNGLNGVQTYIQTHPQAHSHMEKLSESQGHSQMPGDTQTRLQSLLELQTQSQLLLQPQIQTQSHVHSQHLMHSQSHHTHALSHAPTASSQLTHVQSQLPAPQSPVMYSVADMLDHMPVSQVSKPGDEISSVRIPVTRTSQNSSSGSLQDMPSPAVDLGEIHSPQAKLYSALSSLSDSSALSSLSESSQIHFATVGIHQVFSPAQVLDALVTSKTKNSPNAGNLLTSVSSTGLDSICGLISPEKSEDQSTLSESSMLNSHLSNAGHVHAEVAKLEVPDVSNISSVIASNKWLNSLLDATKPHVPSHIAKAAELAHLIPSPNVRVANALRAGEIENGNMDSVFATPNRESVPLSTATQTCGTNITGNMRNPSAYGDNKGLSSSLLENANVSSTLPLSNNSVLLSTFTGHNQTPQQRQCDALQQVLVGQNIANLDEPHLEAFSNESVRLLNSISAPQSLPVTSCAISGINTSALSSVDRSVKKVLLAPLNQANLPKPISNLGLIDLIPKSNVVADNQSRPVTNVFTKQGLITSTDPMFSTVVTAANSPSSLNSYGLSKCVMSQETLHRAKSHATDSRVSHLADIINRTSSSDIMLSGASGNLLLGMTDTRISHTGDILLSELHRSDESDLSLSSTLTGTGDDLPGNASTLVTDTGLGNSIGADTAALHVLPSSPPLQGLPSPPLSSFSLHSIPSDFMVSGISSSKLPSVQGQFPALLSSLATTSDFDQLLENSMCIDMNSLSESEVSLSTASSSFPYSPEKPVTVKKSTSPLSDLTFTSALKAADLKIDIEFEDGVHHSAAFQPHIEKASQPDAGISSLSDLQETVSQMTSGASGHKESTLLYKKPEAQANLKPSSVYKGKKKREILKKNELLVQQVACFKCRLCSFLSQDKDEMGNHMKRFHSQYLSDSEESESEPILSSKKVKVHVPKKNPVFESVPGLDIQASIKTRAKHQSSKQGKKVECRMGNWNTSSNSVFFVRDESSREHIEENDSSGVHIFIKTDTDPNCTIVKDNTEEPREPDINPESEQDGGDDTKTQETHITADAVLDHSGGITKKKRKRIKASADGIKCDLNGCTYKMINESNIEYHRKCHSGGKFRCLECNEEFVMWSVLAVHLWRQHMIDMELHTCDKCNYKSYSYSKLMNIHYKIHSDERPSICDICGKGFKTPKQLRSHKSVHLRKQSSTTIRCDKCQRTFSDKRMLRNHLDSVHNKVKPFLCNYCGYSTASKSTLKMHMRQHT